MPKSKSKLKQAIDLVDEMEAEDLEELRRCIDRRLGDDDSTEDCEGDEDDEEEDDD